MSLAIDILLLFDDKWTKRPVLNLIVQTDYMAKWVSNIFIFPCLGRLL